MENCDFAAQRNPANFSPIRKFRTFYISSQIRQNFAQILHNFLNFVILNILLVLSLNKCCYTIALFVDEIFGRSW